MKSSKKQTGAPFPGGDEPPLCSRRMRRRWHYLILAIVFFGINIFPFLIDHAVAEAPVNASDIWGAISRPGIELEHDLHSVLITAYSSSPDETSDMPFITASGEHVKSGIVAANFLSFGTKIKIPKLFGERIFTVEDRMNKRFNHRVDVWMPSKQKAIDFGIAKADILVLE